VLLAGGIDPKEAAAQLEVALSTVRSQLKSIFAKTDTSRQSELVRLLLLGPARLLPETDKTQQGGVR
jgi:DNA-binding CsgD family transcriptional regulator